MQENLSLTTQWCWGGIGVCKGIFWSRATPEPIVSPLSSVRWRMRKGGKRRAGWQIIYIIKEFKNNVYNSILWQKALQAAPAQHAQCSFEKNPSQREPTGSLVSSSFTSMLCSHFLCLVLFQAMHGSYSFSLGLWSAGCNKSVIDNCSEVPKMLQRSLPVSCIPTRFGVNGQRN